MNKIKTNHPFTKKQLEVLNKELQKVSNTQIAALRGASIPGKDNFTDVDVLHSPYNLDVFLSFIDITIPNKPVAEIYAISSTGKVDKKIRSTMKFETLSDRIHFFNTLISIEFEQ